MILARVMLSHDFINFKVKIGIKELGNDVYFIKKNMKFYIVETEEIRRKQVSSLKTYRLQDQLVIDKFGVSCKTFFSKYRDSSCGSAVPLQTWFQNDFYFRHVSTRSKNLCTNV
jgi:hypothetical protein